MKKNLLTLATILTIGFFTNNITAQTTTTTTTGSIEGSDVGAVILQPLTISNSQALHFGTIISNATTEGTVTVATDGTRSVAGAALSTSGGTPSTVAQYSTAGPKSAAYHITLPIDTDVKVSNGNSSQDMTVTAFTARFGGSTSDDVSSVMDADTGVGTVAVGATLNLAIGQSAGIYTGSFNVSVDFD